LWYDARPVAGRTLYLIGSGAPAAVLNNN